MTRIELYDTLRKLGYHVTGLANNDIRIQKGRQEPMVVSEPEAVEFATKHDRTHCLACGRAYPKGDDEDE